MYYTRVGSYRILVWGGIGGIHCSLSRELETAKRLAATKEQMQHEVKRLKSEFQTPKKALADKQALADAQNSVRTFTVKCLGQGAEGATELKKAIL